MLIFSRREMNQLKWNLFLLLLIVGVPVIISQGIFEQWGVVGCLAPFVGCGALIGLLTLKGFKEDNGDTKVSFEPPVRDEKSHEMAVAMVRQMVGQQIRLVSVHWSDPERDEYLYTPDIEHGSGIVGWREVASWVDEPTEDILSKSRYMVEPVPGQEDVIRLVSVHWSDSERYEYLYTSREWTDASRRHIHSWKIEPTNDILSKSRYRVEFVHSSKEEETEEENWWEDEKQ